MIATVSSIKQYVVRVTFAHLNIFLTLFSLCTAFEFCLFVRFLPSVAVITVWAPLKGPTPTAVSAAMVKM